MLARLAQLLKDTPFGRENDNVKWRTLHPEHRGKTLRQLTPVFAEMGANSSSTVLFKEEPDATTLARMNLEDVPDHAVYRGLTVDRRDKMKPVFHVPVEP